MALGYVPPRLVVDDDDKPVALVQPVQPGDHAEGRIEGQGCPDFLLGPDDARHPEPLARLSLALQEHLHLLKGRLGAEPPQGGAPDPVLRRR